MPVTLCPFLRVLFVHCKHVDAKVPPDTIQSRLFQSVLHERGIFQHLCSHWCLQQSPADEPLEIHSDLNKEGADILHS